MSTRAPGPGCYLDPEGSSATVDGPALFLDRDGVINVDRGYVATPERTEWMPGIFELCAKGRAAGLGLVVVTNQAGIARGYYSEAQFLDYTRWIHASFRARGVPLAATLYCPHHPIAGIGALNVTCSCRKPAPGMLLEARRRLKIDLGASALVGDKPSDVHAGAAAGVGSLYYVGPPHAFTIEVTPCSTLAAVSDQLG